jgi:hypothetical protein
MEKGKEEELRKEGKLSYIQMRELMRGEIGLNVEATACTVLGPEVQQQWQMEAS